MAPKLQHKTKLTIDKIRQKCLRRGENGIRGLSRSFRCMDDDRSFSLSYTEFTEGLKNYGIVLPSDEMNLILRAFDINGDGQIDMNEFLKFIRGGMSQRRMSVVLAAFAKLDRDGSGMIDPNDIRTVYDCSRHPAVLRGEKTQDTVLFEFLASFESGGTVDGKVTKQEFLDYYSGVSAGMDSDIHFVLMVQRAWKLTDAEVEGGGDDGAAHREKRPAAKIPNPDKDSKLYMEMPKESSKRIVGYTGHIPTMQDTHGERFQVTESHSPHRCGRYIVPRNPIKDDNVALVREGNKANQHNAVIM